MVKYFVFLIGFSHYLIRHVNCEASPLGAVGLVWNESLPVINLVEPAHSSLNVLEGTRNIAIFCEALHKNSNTELQWTWLHDGKPAEISLTSCVKSFHQSNNETTSFSWLFFPTVILACEGNYACIFESTLGSNEFSQSIVVLPLNDMPTCKHTSEVINETFFLNYSDTTITQDLPRGVNQTRHEVKRSVISYSSWTQRPRSSVKPDWYYKFWNRNMNELISLIAQRLLLGDKVAVAKWDSGTAIEDLPRENEVIQSVVSQAEVAGLDSNWAQLFFRDQIEANKQVQRDLHDYWRINGQRPNGPPVDLVKEVRPQINAINRHMIALSQSTMETRGSSGCVLERDRSIRHVAYNFKLDSLHQTALQRAVSNVCLK